MNDISFVLKVKYYFGLTLWQKNNLSFSTTCYFSIIAVPVAFLRCNWI